MEVVGLFKKINEKEEDNVRLRADLAKTVADIEKQEDLMIRAQSLNKEQEKKIDQLQKVFEAKESEIQSFNVQITNLQSIKERLIEENKKSNELILQLNQSLEKEKYKVEDYKNKQETEWKETERDLEEKLICFRNKMVSLKEGIELEQNQMRVCESKLKQEQSIIMEKDRKLVELERKVNDFHVQLTLKNNTIDILLKKDSERESENDDRVIQLESQLLLKTQECQREVSKRKKLLEGQLEIDSGSLASTSTSVIVPPASHVGNDKEFVKLKIALDEQISQRQQEKEIFSKKEQLFFIDMQNFERLKQRIHDFVSFVNMDAAISGSPVDKCKELEEQLACIKDIFMLKGKQFSEIRSNLEQQQLAFASLSQQLKTKNEAFGETKKDLEKVISNNLCI
eukprot:Awhi_evm1s4860